MYILESEIGLEDEDRERDQNSEDQILLELKLAEKEGVGEFLTPGLMKDAEEINLILGDFPPFIGNENTMGLPGEATQGVLLRELSEMSRKVSNIEIKSRSNSTAQKERSNSVKNQYVERNNELKGRLIKEEKMERGRVKCKNYGKFIKYGGLCAGLFVLLFFSMSSAMRIIGQWWVGMWSIDAYNKDGLWYFKYYCYIGIALGVIALLRGFALAFFLRNLAKSCQIRLIKVLLQSPLSWFDTTPTGRIINRAIKDQMTIDEEIPFLLASTIRMVLYISGSLVIICIISPYFVVVMFILIIVYIFWYSNVIQYGRDTRRLESVSRSPIFSLFEESLEGLCTIRACGLQNIFMKKMEKQLNTTHKANFANAVGVRWMNMRLELVGTFAVGFAALFAVLNKDDIEANMAGLSIFNSLIITTMLGFMLTNLGNLEVKMSSMERMMEYIEENPQEKPFRYEQPRVPSNWPDKGKIEVNNLYLKYQPHLNTVINGISFVCQPGERIGVVGRTGSGKTTLTLGLLRILEPYIGIDNAQGKSVNHSWNICIDGVDVTEIGLHELRTQIAMIPQDPVLFSGTIQTNLDPFDKISFQEKVQALKLTGLLDQLWKRICEERKDEDSGAEGVKKRENNIDIKDEIIIDNIYETNMQMRYIIYIYIYIV